MKKTYTRIELGRKARVFMEQRYGKSKDAKDQDEWYTRLGMLYDFVTALYDGELDNPEGQASSEERNTMKHKQKIKGMHDLRMPARMLRQGMVVRWLKGSLLGPPETILSVEREGLPRAGIWITLKGGKTWCRCPGNRYVMDEDAKKAGL